MPDGRAAREARLATALRENLKRRKAASGAAERPDALVEGAVHEPSGDGSGARAFSCEADPAHVKKTRQGKSES